VRARVIKRSLIFQRILFKFRVNILHITTSSKVYVLFMFTHCAPRARACARACVINLSIIYGPILFAGYIQQMTTSYMGYTLIFTRRGHTRERACASARVINCSLIYGRFLFKFRVNILHITTSSKGYVLFMFTHRAHACKRACSSARVV
jgi:hypothetical protein